MEKTSIYLASSSARRQEMLAWVIDNFVSIAADIDETPKENENPIQYCYRMAIEKSDKVSPEIREENAIIITSDTTVYRDGKIFGKPENPARAKEILSEINGCSHHVCTSLCVSKKEGATIWKKTSLCETVVNMRNMAEAEIDAFIESGEPMGKAGAYAIQNKTFHPVDHIQGCFACVVGFPLCHLQRVFQQFSIDLPRNPQHCCKSHIPFVCQLQIPDLNIRIHNV